MPSTLSRARVVLVAMTPSMRWRRRASAMLVIWASSRSGAILNEHRHVAAVPVKPVLSGESSTAPIKAVTAPIRPAIARRFFVLGLEMFTAM
jgi:hypothetical protein